MKTVKVRIALVVNSNGYWSAYGFPKDGPRDESMMMDNACDGMGEPNGVEAKHWITAEVEVPEVKETPGVVSTEPQWERPKESE